MIDGAWLELMEASGDQQELAEPKSGGVGGGHEETKKSQQAGKEKKTGFLALCMAHSSASEWGSNPKKRHGRLFRDAIRLIQLEVLLEIGVSG